MKQNLFLFAVLPLLFIVSRQLLANSPANTNTTITVTTTSDVIASDGECALREAIIAANTDMAFNECPAGNGADTIVFDPALTADFVLTLTDANEDQAQTGDLDISGTVTISGTGQTVIDGNDSDRVFHVLSGARLTLAGVTVQHGNPGAANGGGIYTVGGLTVSNSTITANHSGGIYNAGGLLELTNVDIDNNLNGYGLYNANTGSLNYSGGSVSGNEGGGIYNNASPATLTNLNIISNTIGGGVYNITSLSSSRLTISQSVVMSNTTTTNGGGIFNEGIGADMDIFDTRIRGNTAVSSGGGIYNNGIMDINGSTLDNNSARSGGGIEHSGVSLHITNSTISGNSVSDNGGGFYNKGSATLTHVTLSGNTANGPDTGGNIFNDEALLTLQNSIVANSPTDGNCFYSAGTVTSSGNNLDDGNTCNFTHAGDIVNTNPLLGPLQNNGGPTFTQALLSGSPAINEANSAFCPATDQRGFTRPAAACDIGAYEAASVYVYLPIILRN